MDDIEIEEGPFVFSNTEGMNFIQKIQNKYQRWKEKIVDLTSNKEEDKIHGTGWERLGYHKTIGRFLYTIGLMIPSAIFGLLLLPLLKFTVYLNPFIKSIEGSAAALFGALYVILDLELQPAVDRFVPQYAVSDPKRAMQYVTFFIKYQMWSGLFQIAFVSWYVFYYIIPNTMWVHFAWFILFINIKQYPAILSTFQSVIASLQYGDKEKLIIFFRADILEPVTGVLFGLIGYWYGATHPSWGLYYGIALGWAIGHYVDDFLTFTLGMKWLGDIIKKYKNDDGTPLRIRDLYGQKVPKEVWASALNYSARLWPKAFIGAIMGLVGFVITYEGVPGYLSYRTLITESEGLKKIVGWSDDILNGSQPILAEAFGNGKINLTKYYIGQGLKYHMMFFMILGNFSIFAFPIMVEVVLVVLLNESWVLIAQIVPIMILLWLWSPFNDVANKMIYLSHHPEINTILDYIGAFVNLFFTWYFIIVLQLGWLGMVLVGVPMSLFSLIVRWIYMQKKIITLDKQFWKDYLWSMFVAPCIAGGLFILFLLFSIYAIWPVISAPFLGSELILIPAIVLLLILVFGGVLGIYLPALAYFGFWDERSLNEFRRAVAVSGPSLIIVWTFYKIFDKFHKKSPFKKRGYVKLGEKAEEELKELSLIRYKKMLGQK